MPEKRSSETRRGPLYPAWSLGSALLIFVIIETLALLRTGGVFEYPLDDVYIHLAIAEEVSRGGYGVNPGELAAASSSPIYPFLLVPWAGTAAQRYLPIFWCAIGLVASSLLWGQLLSRAGFQAPALWNTGRILAVLGPPALNMAGLAVMGLEHSLQLACTLALLAGLHQFLVDGRTGWLLIVGIVLGPTLRLESVALSLLACGVVLWRRSARAGLVSLLMAILPVAGFLLLLRSLGLDLLPNSVVAKLGGLNTDDLAGAARNMVRLTGNLSRDGGRVLAVAAGLWVLPPLFDPTLRKGARAALWSTLLLGAAAHLCVGRIGSVDRYECYILAYVAGASVILAVPWMSRRAAWRVVVPLALFLIGTHYATSQCLTLPESAAAVRLQQAQMARFARDYVHAPVAVNDLGYVAWASPHYVLDLWGLASPEALHKRLGDSPSGWGGPLAEEHGVELAMIYDSWLANAASPDWVKLGELQLDVPRGYVSHDRVAFYATRLESVSKLREELGAFVPTLPHGASFRFGAPTYGNGSGRPAR